MNRVVTTTRRRRAAGFTLLELMIASTAGALVVASLVYVSNASTSYFREQQRIANTQSSLRLAMDQIRRDFARAGFGATPNSLFPDYQPCQQVGAPQQIQAFQVFDNITLAPLINPTGEHSLDGQALQGDGVRLMGNYATSSEYTIRGVQAGLDVGVQTDSIAFARDFTSWVAGPPYNVVPDLFNNAFLVGRLVRLRGTEGNRFFAYVAGTAPNLNPPVVRLSAPLQPACSTLAGGMISPVSVLDYTLMAAAGPAANNNVAAAGINTQLVRQEIALNNNAQLANTFNQVVAEHVVNFNVELITNTNAVRTMPVVLATAVGANAAAAPPERIFSAIVTLSVRTALPDPRFPWIAQDPGAELTRFRFNPAPDLRAARVRTARAEIFLPNIANEWTN